MCLPSIVLRCFILLLVTLFSKSQENSTNGFEQSSNSTVQNNPLVNSVKYQNDEIEPTRCNSHKNSIKSNEMQYESCINSTKNNCKSDLEQYESRGHIIKNREENNQTSTESCANSTEINDSMFQEINENLTKTEGRNNSTLHNFYKISNAESNIMTTVVPYKECNNVSCIQLCCPFGNILTLTGECVAGQGNYSFPDTYKYKDDSQDEKFNKLFLTVRDPCVINEVGRRLLADNTYLFLVNGSLYQGPSEPLRLPPSYCLAVLLRNVYDVIICTNQTGLPTYISICYLVSLPFLLLTFIVYSVLPELQNVHGNSLRAHVASLFISYAIMYIDQLTPKLATYSICIPLAYIFNFFFLSSFFWLNVICFDIWWAFSGFHSNRTRVKLEKKKFIIYSIYAWGIPVILDVICAIIDNVPEMPQNLIQPEICKRKFWYGDDYAKTMYFYIPMSATVISNICFFIATIATIHCRDIHVDFRMKDWEKKRHNENKQRKNMYLTLFVVMGISWVMEIISWMISNEIVPAFVWYPTNMINSLQGVIIFIIFVCRKRIKRLLLKRFGGKNCGPFCKIPTNNYSTNSNIISLKTGPISMQEIPSA